MEFVSCGIDCQCMHTSPQNERGNEWSVCLITYGSFLLVNTFYLRFSQRTALRLHSSNHWPATGRCSRFHTIIEASSFVITPGYILHVQHGVCTGYELTGVET